MLYVICFKDNSFEVCRSGDFKREWADVVYGVLDPWSVKIVQCFSCAIDGNGEEVSVSAPVWYSIIGKVVQNALDRVK